MGYAVRQNDSAGKTVECEPSVGLGDFVYLSSTSKVDQAQANSVNTMPAVGYVKRMLNNGKCVIVQFELEKNLSGLSIKERFFISPTLPGKITNIAPTDAEHVLQCVAEAKSVTERLVSIDPTNYVIRQ